MLSNRSDADVHPKQLRIACVGVAASVRTAVHQVCMDSTVFVFCGAARSTVLLLQKLAQAPPDIVLMDDGLLRSCGLTELAQLHRALPAARAVLIGDALDLSAIYPSLRLGLCGMVARVQVTVSLERALSAVAAGDLWLSRHQLARLVMVTSGHQQSEWFDLTPRENAVVQRVLLGDSNKQVARALNIAEHTVKIHLHHIYSKLGVHRRVELVATLLWPPCNEREDHSADTRITSATRPQIARQLHAAPFR